MLTTEASQTQPGDPRGTQCCKSLSIASVPGRMGLSKRTQLSGPPNSVGSRNLRSLPVARKFQVGHKEETQSRDRSRVGRTVTDGTCGEQLGRHDGTPTVVSEWAGGPEGRR